MKKKISTFLTYHIRYLLLIIFLGFFAYVNTLGNGFVSDDLAIISQNKLIGSPMYFWSSPAAIVRPFFYYVMYQLWGANPLPFHLLNIFFHLGTAVLLYVLAFYTTHKKKVSFIAACLFVVHPAISEGVTWISGGNYPQYGFFMTIAILFYIFRYRHKRFLSLSVFFYFFTLLSSQKAVVLPLVLMTYEYCFGSLKKNWKDNVPFMAVSILYAILYLFKIGPRIDSLDNDYYVGGGKFENIFLKLPFAITSYIQLLFYPSRLTLYHSELMNPLEYAVRLIGFISFITVLFITHYKNKQIFFWLVFFILNLLLVLTPLKVASTIAERYMYYASFGIIISIVLFFSQLLRHIKMKKMIACGVGLIIFALMIRTFVRNFDWSEELVFWSQTARASPNSFSVQNNLGAAYARINEDKKAAQAFKAAIELNPQYADAYKNLGYIYLKQNNPDRALQYYAKALQLNSRSWVFYNDLGAAYIAKKDYKKAEKHFIQALQISPNNELVYINLARTYLMQNNKEKAALKLKELLIINPNNELAKQLLQQI